MNINYIFSVMSRKYASSCDHTYAMSYCSSGHLTWIPTVLEETVQRPTSSTGVRPIAYGITSQREQPAEIAQQKLEVQSSELHHLEKKKRYVFRRLRSSKNECLSVNLYTIFKKKIHLL